MSSSTRLVRWSVGWQSWEMQGHGRPENVPTSSVDRETETRLLKVTAKARGKVTERRSKLTTPGTTWRVRGSKFDDFMARKAPLNGRNKTGQGFCYLFQPKKCRETKFRRFHACGGCHKWNSPYAELIACAWRPEPVSQLSIIPRRHRPTQ